MTSISKPERICAVIPFYNERLSIERIINDTLKYADVVIAVNDGSDDGSEKLVPVNGRVLLINIISNKGKGAALRTGFQKSISSGYDYTIALDADLQHPPEYIPLFVESLKKGSSFVIGNRLHNLSGIPPQRILSNKLSSWLLSLKTGMKIIDSQCGYRGYRNSTLKEILPVSSGYEAESEMIILAGRKNITVDFVEIPAVYGNEVSKIKPVKLIFRFIKVLLKF